LFDGSASLIGAHLKSQTRRPRRLSATEVGTAARRNQQGSFNAADAEPKLGPLYPQNRPEKLTSQSERLSNWLVLDDKVLETRAISAHPPVVKQLRLKAEKAPPGRQYTLPEGSDPDGDPLTYVVQMSGAATCGIPSPLALRNRASR
jgi:hypothetical protein